MNYRHHYHAGNFADVVKHIVLLAVVEALQRKEKGFLYLDTHAGRGSYDLARAAQGDSLERRPEWPEGIGRLEATVPAERPAAVSALVRAVEQFRAAAGGGLLYPGSPELMRAHVRPQDRVLLCEKHPEEFALLAASFTAVRRARVECADGYLAVRSALPPLERRALVLIDPPYENTDEFAQIVAALSEGLRRLPSATFAVWYPLTERARVEPFFASLSRIALPPTWTAEMTVLGPAAPQRMKGCGVLVVNPPWQLNQTLEPALEWLGKTLAQAPEAASAMRWLVRE